jgi:Zn-dependent metalloprotease
MANEGGASIPVPDPEHQKRQRRRARKRKLTIYCGSGGGLIVIGLIVWWVFFFVAVYKTVDEALEKIRADHPSAKVYRDPSSGYVAALSSLEQSTQSNEAGISAVKLATDFIERPEVAAALGVKEVKVEALGTQPDPLLKNYEVVRLKQVVDGVRLFGADLVVTQRRSESGAAIAAVAVRPGPAPAVDLTPAIDESAARATARAEYEKLAKEPASRLPAPPPLAEMTDPERVVFDPARFGLEGEAALAWRYPIGHVQVFVNAKDGRVIVSYDERPTARTLLVHDCAQAFDCPQVLNENGALKGKSPVGSDAKSAQAAALAAHKYFKDTFKRDGFDDAAGGGGKEKISMFVQVADLNNAQWVKDDRIFEFGRGWTTLDIAGHEYGHAVTHFGPNIEYLGQAGAVSEFFADFFGVMIDRSVTKVLDWRIGEGLPGFSAASPLRNMAAPHNGGFNPKLKADRKTNGGQPEDFTELVTPKQEICGGLGGDPPDKGCVHFNSGILNKALHLAIAGGTFKGTTVTPIALSRVEQIMFRTLILGGVTSAPTLLDTANGAVRTCRFMAERKLNEVTTADCTALRTAFGAVKMTVAP